MARQLVILVLVCASALSVCQEDEVDYGELMQAFSSAVKVVNKMGHVKSSDPPTDGKRHYALLLAVLLRLNDLLYESCTNSYDDLYMDVVQRVVPKAWSHPKKYIDKLKETISRVKKQVKMAKKPMKKEGKGVTLDAVDREALNLMQAVGELSKAYLNNTYEAEAKDYSIVRLLVKGKEDLREVVMKSLKVRTLLDGENDKCSSTTMTTNSV